MHKDLILQPSVITPNAASAIARPAVGHAAVQALPVPAMGFDPLTADRLTLWRHGYPARPVEPELLAQWMDLVGAPMRHIQCKVTRNENHFNGRISITEGSESSNNWSGAVVYAPAGTAFYQVAGRWTVPNPTSPSNGKDYEGSFWVGIDGDKSTDVFQGGVRCSVSTNGSKNLDITAWVEWAPDAENDVDFPVKAGDVIGCTATIDDDCLPGYAVDHGQWATVNDNHQLIPMSDGHVLDWVPDNGAWRLWKYDPQAKDCLAGELAYGTWTTIGDGHILVPMSDGHVLDWVPDTGAWRLWQYEVKPGQCLHGPVSSGQWKTIVGDHQLIPMPDGKVLDFVPGDGTWRLWAYSAKSADCLPYEVAAGQWQTIDNDDVLLAMHDGRVLDWVPGDGRWFLWQYDPAGHSLVSGSIVLRNHTQNLHAGLRITAPAGSYLQGNCAEWVAERPKVSGSLALLPNYGTVTFTKATAVKSGAVTVQAGSGTVISMTEGGTTVSKATASGTTVNCKFV